MTYPIAQIEGLGPEAARQLKSLGIRTTEKLLDAASSAKGRKLIAARTGLSETDLLAWANIADCMRIKGLGKAKAELLRAAGVNTLRELAHRNPARLAAAMEAANAERKRMGIRPSGESVAKLIAQAKKLPIKISY